MMSDFWPGGGAVLLCWCVLGTAGCADKRPTITVGARNLTEQAILGEILAQHLTKRLPQAHVERQFGVGSTLLADAALRAGDIDFYVEYSGAALTMLGIAPQEDRDSVREQVLQGYRQTRQSEWFGPLGFDNRPVLVITEASAAKLGVRTLSQAAGRTEGWLLGLLPEFRDRPDGIPLLVRRYRIGFDGPMRNLEPGRLYAELASGAVSMIMGYATDAALDPAKFMALEDDQHAFPPYEAGIVARTEAMQQIPGLAGALKELTGKISTGQMRAMNRRVEAEGAAADRVASDFLKGAGL